MEKVGVEAVVEGLAGFLGDMKKMDSAISGLVPGTKLLENAFGFLGNTIDGFVNFTLNTLAHALGELVADAVEFVIQKLGELVQATIEAGGEFQTLELRLQTLNFNSLVESGMKYNEATAKSIELTREQLDWLQKLAVTTPYDAQDIANTFTLARSYGFVDDEAKNLTESIINFASGMGLGNTEIQRIIVNFGQMVQQGKVTQREMNDLARGSFVPVNDVLKLMAKNLGMSTDELTSFRQTAESVPEFMKAFQQLVGERFTGSAEKMAKTFQGATANLKDLVKSLGGLNVVKPILDVIGTRIADFITTLTKGKNWDNLVSAAKKLGNSLSGIVSTLTGFLPDAKSVAAGVVNALEGIADWINQHRSDITDWIIQASRWINNVLIPDIQRVVRWLFGTSMEKGAIQKFGQWLEETFMPLLGKVWNWVKETLVPFMEDKLPGLLDALGSLGDSILEVIGAIFDNDKTTDTSWIDDLTTGIKDFATWVSENKDTIAQWVERLITATVYLAILISLLSTAVGWIATITAAFFNWWVISDPLAKALLAIGLAIAGWNLLTLIAPLLLIIALIAGLELDWALLKAFFLEFVTVFKAGWKDMADNAAESVQRIKDAIQSGDWIQVGLEIVRSVAQAILDFGWMIGDALVSAVNKSFNQLTSLIGLPDMSVLLPGSNSTMAGSSVNSNTTNTNNYNLNINSSAQHEPIVQDFFMMQSFQGR